MHTPIESLEIRRLLSAANVTVTADSSLNAQIVGDKKNDAIVITLSPNGGYLVTGLRGTKVNGAAAVTINTPSALNFTIDLGKGNDQVIFNGSAAGGGPFSTQALAINTGDGNDVVILSNTTHFGDVSITTDKGNDAVTLDAIHGTQNVSIVTGKGNDNLTFASPSQVDGNATIDAGAGNNRVSGRTSLSVAGTNSFLGLSPVNAKHAPKPKKDHAGDEQGDAD